MAIVPASSMFSRGQSSVGGGVVEYAVAAGVGGACSIDPEQAAASSADATHMLRPADQVVDPTEPIVISPATVACAGSAAGIPAKWVEKA
jgi:hypothetical protein